MEYSKDQLKYSIHKNSYGYYLIIPNGQLTKTKNAHLYEHEIHPTWTLIEPISKDIQIGSNSSHIITIIQFLIQLVTTGTIHWTRGLTLDYLAFDPTNVYKHGLTYITFSRVKRKEFFYLLQPL